MSSSIRIFDSFATTLSLWGCERDKEKGIGRRRERCSARARIEAGGRLGGPAEFHKAPPGTRGCPGSRPQRGWTEGMTGMTKQQS